jgi:hypothetical protein
MKRYITIHSVNFSLFLLTKNLEYFCKCIESLQRYMKRYIMIHSVNFLLNSTHRERKNKFEIWIESL